MYSSQESLLEASFISLHLLDYYCFVVCVKATHDLYSRCWFLSCFVGVNWDNILYEGRMSGREFNPPMADKF